MGAVKELERGRQSYEARSWADAHDSLSKADQAAPLAAVDIERMATSAYMLGRDDEYVSALERAHQGYLDSEEATHAVRCAFWVGMNLGLRGEMARATGWWGRAERLLEREGHDCVERGYLMIPILLEQLAAGDWDAAADTAAEAAAVGERFGDADLVALAIHERGHALVRQRRAGEGLRLLDEAMVAVTAGELTPIVTGLVYCSVIAYCQELYELRRAREWTAALTRWCEQQPDMVAHAGMCLVHRAEIMELGGAWPEALEEARRARERFAAGMTNERAIGQALYRQGEVHRLRGEFAAAEESFKEASRGGWEPQPGLALLRLAQGKVDAAAAAIRRVVGETGEPEKLERLLPAYVEIMLAVGELEEARGGCRRLADISEGYDSAVRAALVAQTSGAVHLAEGDARAGLVELRRASQGWQELGAPYEVARARVLVGLACRALGDDDACALEFEAARAAFDQLGAAPDLVRIDALVGPGEPRDAHRLTQRELEVLRLVAAGSTNKAIAAELVLSERTVDRHVSNILGKLRVSSRAAATAYAYQHQLV